MPMEGREAGGIAKEQKNRTPEPRYLGQDGSTELTDQGYQREYRLATGDADEFTAEIGSLPAR